MDGRGIVEGGEEGLEGLVIETDGEGSGGNGREEDWKLGSVGEYWCERARG